MDIVEEAERIAMEYSKELAKAETARELGPLIRQHGFGEPSKVLEALKREAEGATEERKSEIELLLSSMSLRSRIEEELSQTFPNPTSVSVLLSQQNEIARRASSKGIPISPIQPPIYIRTPLDCQGPLKGAKSTLEHIMVELTGRMITKPGGRITIRGELEAKGIYNKLDADEKAEVEDIDDLLTTKPRAAIALMGALMDVMLTDLLMREPKIDRNEKESLKNNFQRTLDKLKKHYSEQKERQLQDMCVLIELGDLKNLWDKAKHTRRSLDGMTQRNAETFAIRMAREIMPQIIGRRVRIKRKSAPQDQG